MNVRRTRAEARPVLGNDREKVTPDAAAKLANCFTKMVARRSDRAQRFVLRAMIAIFAEDIGSLPRYLFTNHVKECEKPEDSYDKLGGLFEAMNTNPPVAGGRYKSVRYFNGGIFRNPTRVEFYSDELAQLRGNDGKLLGATDSDWSKVDRDFRPDFPGRHERRGTPRLRRVPRNNCESSAMSECCKALKSNIHILCLQMYNRRH